MLPLLSLEKNHFCMGEACTEIGLANELVTSLIKPSKRAIVATADVKVHPILLKLYRFVCYLHVTPKDFSRKSQRCSKDDPLVVNYGSLVTALF